MQLFIQVYFSALSLYYNIDSIEITSKTKQRNSAGSGKLVRDRKDKQTSVKNVTSKQFIIVTDLLFGKATKENFADGGNILTNYAAPSWPFAK